MPNILEVIRELKHLQGKESAGQATASDKARIAELQKFMKGTAKPDPAPAGPPVRPPAVAPSSSSSNAPTMPRANPAAKPAAPVGKVAPPARAPVAPPMDGPTTRQSPPKPAPRPGEPDANAFSLSLDDDLAGALEGIDGEGSTQKGDRAAATTHEAEELELSNPFAINLEDAGIAEEPDESDAAKTTFEVDEDSTALGADGSNPHGLALPEGLDGLALAEDDEGGVRHEVDDEELAAAAVADDPYKVGLAADFEKELVKSDGKNVAAPVAAGPKGTPMVPDAHYEKIAATDTSVVVQLRDGRIAKGQAGAFSPAAPTFTLNQLVPNQKPVAIKLDDCLTIRFVKAYNAGAACTTAFPAGSKPLAGSGERVTVKLLDGETLVGNALPHKPNESFILVPAAPTTNVRRIWVSAKAVRSYTPG